MKKLFTNTPLNGISLLDKEFIKQKYSCYQLINCSCPNCKKVFTLQIKAFLKRENLLCNRCSSNVLPEKDFISADELQFLNKKPSNKQKIKFKCSICGNFDIKQYRHYLNSGNICQNCGRKIHNKSNSDEVKAKAKHTKIQKYGKNYGEFYSKALQNGMMKKYGVNATMHSAELKQKVYLSQQEKYGGWALSNKEIHNKTVKTSKANNSYSKKSFWKNKSKEDLQKILSKRSKRYVYNGIGFDSSWELAFFIYHKDLNNIIIREPCYFIYYKNNISHKYIVDFSVNGNLFEIKSNYLINQLKDYPEKYHCLLENNITIINDEKIKPYLSYIYSKYGKNYLKQFRNF